MTMLSERSLISEKLFSDSVCLLTSINDIEHCRARMVFEAIHPSYSFQANLIWKSRQNVDSRNQNNISNDHEYILVFGGDFRGGDKDFNKYSNQTMIQEVNG